MRAPVAAFGTGGSGTRAVAAIVREAGVYLGPRLNKALDSLVLKDFLRPRIDGYLERSGWIQAMTREPQGTPIEPAGQELRDDLAAAMVLQREGIPAPDARWGWKAPRSIYILPLLDQAYPELVTIQLVRDGRDMAYSANQQQRDAYWGLLVPELAGAPSPVASIGVWSRVNLAAARYGRAFLGERHMVLRYEDLCADPETAVGRVLGHLGVQPSDELRTRAVAEVEPSSASGRWRAREDEEVAAVRAAGEEGLREFGYL